MNNTDKLLRAFIDASGYEIEEVTTTQKMFRMENINGDGVPKANKLPECTINNIDYKITKRDDAQRRYNLYISALNEYRYGITSIEQFLEITEGLL